MIKLLSPLPKKNQVQIERYDWKVSNTVKFNKKITLNNQSFISVLTTRKTRRIFSGLEQSLLGDLLYLSNRMIEREVNAQGLLVEHRPVISSGGLQAVDILISNPKNNKWYRYCSENHLLQELNKDYDFSNVRITADKFFSSAKNATLIWYVGDFDRISGKYHNPESLLWRDAGAIMSTHSLVSEYLKLAYCPLGITCQDNADLISNQRKLVSLGIALIGARP